jgi:hypothetical protein
MHDGIRLEEAGVPAAVVVTAEFVHEAEVQRAALGMEAIQPAVIDHPLSTLTEEQIRDRGAQAAPQAVGIWTGSRP